MGCTRNWGSSSRRCATIATPQPHHLHSSVTTEPPQLQRQNARPQPRGHNRTATNAKKPDSASQSSAKEGLVFATAQDDKTQGTMRTITHKTKQREEQRTARRRQAWKAATGTQQQRQHQQQHRHESNQKESLPRFLAAANPRRTTTVPTYEQNANM